MNTTAAPFSTPRPGLPFLKMHGLGNDFVVIDQRSGGGVVTPELARRVGDRHRGVGFDQLVTIEPADGADARLTFWNSDGSVSGTCGNATRCIGRLLMDETGKDSVRLVTERGVLTAIDAGDGQTSVNMGPPQLDWAEVPLAGAMDTLTLPIEGDPSAVGMGNPHAVFFVPDVGAVDLARQGAAMEHHPLYPQGANAEYVEVRSPTELRMRVWERGAGITLACGSGACAVAVAAHRRGLTERAVRIELDGGWLSLDWREDGVWMTGPTTLAFRGELDPGLVSA